MCDFGEKNCGGNYACKKLLLEIKKIEKVIVKNVFVEKSKLCFSVSHSRFSK